MPTRNRRQWLPKAIRSYQNQTYEKSELLILADGDDVRDLLPRDERVRLIHLKERRTLGEKRNFACECARGSVICHFDDDDWSEAGRIEDQLPRLDSASVTGYHSLLFTDGDHWWSYTGTPGYALGTSLCYRRDWWKDHRFKPMDVGEDNHFVNAAKNAGALVSVPARGLMYATTHASNTSPRIYGSNWKEVAHP